MNTFDANIQFTNVVKEENKLAFLDLIEIRNPDDNINTRA